VAVSSLLHFIDQDQANVQGLVSEIIKVVDVSYGGEVGFNQARRIAFKTSSSSKKTNFYRGYSNKSVWKPESFA